MSKWIKCSEREHPDLIMDESGEFAASADVLVVCSIGTIVARFEELFDENGCWQRGWVHVDTGSDFSIGNIVTHWQPLPEGANE